MRVCKIMLSSSEDKVTKPFAFVPVTLRRTSFLRFPWLPAPFTVQLDPGIDTTPTGNTVPYKLIVFPAFDHYLMPEMVIYFLCYCYISIFNPPPFSRAHAGVQLRVLQNLRLNKQTFDVPCSANHV